MIDELLSLRALVVSPEEGLRDLFRQAAASLSVPVEIEDAADVVAATNVLAGDADLVYIDNELPREQMAKIALVARAAIKSSFTIMLAAGAPVQAFETDGIAGKPSRREEAVWLLDRSTRIRLPSRVLVVDDSATMRAIIRKALAATRLPLEVSETDSGFKALKLVEENDFHIVFLDHNMPGLSGLETLSAFNREDRRISVVMMSSAQDETLAARARELGAGFLRKPFFPADIERLLCGFYGLRGLNPERA
jgi:CheY-like chemotaxis protein